MFAKNMTLKSFLFNHFYRNPRVMRMAYKAHYIISRLFQAYCDHPLILPKATQRKLKSLPIERVACDYIAGMTDRFAMQEYQRLFDPVERV
jgi:dGTPase